MERLGGAKTVGRLDISAGTELLDEVGLLPAIVGMVRRTSLRLEQDRRGSSGLPEPVGIDKQQ